MTSQWVVTILLCLSMVGCAGRHNRRLDNLNMALKVVQKAVIESIPLGKPSADRSGMQFRSRPFLLVGKKVRLAEKANSRFIAKVFILGDRRPYAIEVDVIRQKRVGGPWTSPIYEDIGTDERIAQIIVRRIQKRLEGSQGKRNVVDDFRVF